MLVLEINIFLGISLVFCESPISEDYIAADGFCFCLNEQVKANIRPGVFI